MLQHLRVQNFAIISDELIFTNSATADDKSMLFEEDENIESIMRVLKIHYKFNYKNEDSMITINTRK